MGKPGRKSQKKAVEEEVTEEVVEEVVEDCDEVEKVEKKVKEDVTDEPTVTDWNAEAADQQIKTKKKAAHKPKEQPKSVINFEREEIVPFEDMKVKDLGNDQLLKVLIQRGRDQDNPVLSGGLERVLQQLKRERIPRNRYHGHNGHNGHNGNNDNNGPNGYNGYNSYRGNRRGSPRGYYGNSRPFLPMDGPKRNRYDDEEPPQRNRNRNRYHDDRDKFSNDRTENRHYADN
jgi:hypothetical protein